MTNKNIVEFLCGLLLILCFIAALTGCFPSNVEPTRRPPVILYDFEIKYSSGEKEIVTASICDMDNNNGAETWGNSVQTAFSVTCYGYLDLGTNDRIDKSSNNVVYSSNDVITVKRLGVSGNQ